MERLSTWENLMSGESYPRLPMPIEVLALEADALSDAYRVSGALGERLRAALDDAHKAEQEIKKVSVAPVAQIQGWQVPMRSAYSYLRSARLALKELGEYLNDNRAQAATG
jgi:hypothetical protein